MKYSWKQMSDDYRIDIFNIDGNNAKKYIVKNNDTGSEYPLFLNSKLNPVLDNDEFIEWAICTTKDFENLVDSRRINKNMLEYIVNNYQFPEIFDSRNSYHIHNLMNEDLWEKAINRNVNALRYMPEYYLTKEKINMFSNLKNVELKGDIYNYLTKEMFEKIYFNCDNEHRRKFISSPSLEYMQISCDRFNKKLCELITPKIAEDLLSLDITLLWQIPKEYISKENAINAMNYDIRLLQFVPAEYQTNEYQKQLIDKNLRFISSIDSKALTNETIFYALSKGNVLKAIPKEKRTLEVCEFAINNHPNAIKSIPRNLLTEEMCFNAIQKDPKIINIVPVEFITTSFVEKLNENNINIPNDCKSYIKLCLETNGKLDDSININQESYNNSIKNDYTDKKFGASLDFYDGLFSVELFDLLKQLNINTVGDLLQKSQDNNFYLAIINNNDKYYKEIDTGIKLLKSKYLDIDPLINIENEKPISDLSNELSFSTRTKNALTRSMYSQEKIMEIIRDKDKHDLLQRISRLGQKSINEVITKMSFVVDYYDRHKNTSQTLDDLYKELEDVKKASSMLDNRIDQLLLKIKQKENIIDKGGISR